MDRSYSSSSEVCEAFKSSTKRKAANRKNSALLEKPWVLIASLIFFSNGLVTVKLMTDIGYGNDIDLILILYEFNAIVKVIAFDRPEWVFLRGRVEESLSWIGEEFGGRDSSATPEYPPRRIGMEKRRI